MRLDGLAFERRGAVYPDVNRIAVDELEAQFAALGNARRRDADFFLYLANGRLDGGLAGFHAPAGAVDLAGPESALLSDQKNLPVANDEEQRRRLRVGFGLRSMEASICVAVMTGYGSEDTAIQAIRSGACNYFKPGGNRGITLGNELPFVLMGGMNVLESRDLALAVAERMGARR